MPPSRRRAQRIRDGHRVPAVSQLTRRAWHGIAGVALQKTFQAVFGQPKYAAVFLTINGLILIAGERFRRHSSREADEETARQREYAELAATGVLKLPGLFGSAGAGIGGQVRQRPGAGGHRLARSGECFASSLASTRSVPGASRDSA